MEINVQLLRLNKYYLNLTNDQAYNLVLQLVQGDVSKTELISYLEQSIIYIEG